MRWDDAFGNDYIAHVKLNENLNPIQHDLLLFVHRFRASKHSRAQVLCGQTAE